MKPDHANPPEAVMRQLIYGKTISRCISIAAELAIADRLNQGKQPIAVLAAATGSDPDALYRVLRMLSGLGIFMELPDRAFQNSPLSELLRSDAPNSLRHYARWFGTTLHWETTAHLDHSVRTGEPAHRKKHPDLGMFELLEQHADAQEIFNHAMSELSRKEARMISEIYAFAHFDRIIDVGGGHGILAESIARVAPDSKLALLELPHVAEGAVRRLEGTGMAGRIEVIGGDFMHRVPGPVDLCLLKHIIHDWNDAEARQILANCRDALAENGRVLVCERLIEPGPENLPARLLDVEMLAGPGGRERTREEFAELLESCGLHLSRLITPPGPMRLIEAAR